MEFVLARNWPKSRAPLVIELASGVSLPSFDSGNITSGNVEPTGSGRPRSLLRTMIPAEVEVFKDDSADGYAASTARRHGSACSIQKMMPGSAEGAVGLWGGPWFVPRNRTGQE